MAERRMAFWKIEVAWAKRGDLSGDCIWREGGITFTCWQASRKFVLAGKLALESFNLDFLLSRVKRVGVTTCLRWWNMVEIVEDQLMYIKK